MAQTYPSSFQKISRNEGGMTLPPNPGARFGIEAVTIGDLNDDGVVDLAVGATNDGGFAIGSVFILFMNRNGTVKSNTKITSSEPAFESDSFGSSVSALGDLDDDGVEDIGIGCQYDDDGGTDNGAFWILFMKTDGTVKARQKISALNGNLPVAIGPGAGFGSGSVAIGDLDSDGNKEVAVGARFTSTTYILFLNDNGTVKSATTISSGQGLSPFDFSGLVSYGLTKLGDVNGDGITDIAIGGHRSDINGVDSGVIYIVFLTATGGVKSSTTIATGLSNFTDTAHLLGISLAGIGDVNGDNVPDMIVGGDDTSNNTGAIWYLMLNTNGTVKSFHKISSETTEVDLDIHPGDQFGSSICDLGDINGDGTRDIAVGAFQDDDGGVDSGAIWISVPKEDCDVVVDAGDDRHVCSTAILQMNGSIPPPGYAGHWSIVSGSGTFSSASDPKATVTELGVGTNILRWTITSTSCGPSYDDLKVVVDAAVRPDAGVDQTYCEGTTALVIEGNEPKNTFGEWSVLSGGGQLLDPYSEVTILKNPSKGVNVLVWKFLSTNYCPLMADTLLVILNPMPVARISLPDTSYTCSTEFSLVAEKPNGTGRWEITEGSGNIREADSAAATLSLKNNNPVHVSWSVSVDECPTDRDSATIIPIDFDADKIPNVITPNNDGYNDRWMIPRIELLPNHIRLYNRWGEEVFKTSNYKNDWAGGDLSGGVYFFFVNLVGCEKEFKGWLNIID